MDSGDKDGLGLAHFSIGSFGVIQFDELVLTQIMSLGLVGLLSYQIRGLEYSATGSDNDGHLTESIDGLDSAHFQP